MTGVLILINMMPPLPVLNAGLSSTRQVFKEAPLEDQLELRSHKAVATQNRLDQGFRVFYRAMGLSKRVLSRRTWLFGTGDTSLKGHMVDDAHPFCFRDYNETRLTSFQ